MSREQIHDTKAVGSPSVRFVLAIARTEQSGWASVNSPRPIRALLVETGSQAQAQDAPAHLDGQEQTLRLCRVQLLADAIRQLDASACDIVLLDLDLPDSQGVATFVRIHQAAPHIPVLVLADAPWRRLDGAESASEVDGREREMDSCDATAVCSLKYAVHRQLEQKGREEGRRRSRREAELMSFERLSLVPGTAVTSQIYSGGALRDAAEEQFNDIVVRYGRILDLAVQRRARGERSGHGEELRGLGDDLGFLRAGPRDVVEMHCAALKARTEETPAHKTQAYFEEGRLVVLELMGNLVNYYRSHFGVINPQGFTS